MGQIAIFETRISQYLQTILSSCHGWRLKLGQNSFAHPRTHFNRLIRIERKIYFGLVCNLPRFPPISMAQMAVQVVSLSLFLLLEFCHGRRIRRSLRAIHRLRLRLVSTRK